ncbi:MAG: hypothetical protein KF757_13105 [Phycisphaeraceae bacterium]|jgi:hypothetical protein|nr:hypothetical protein [Phycisphaeraceae bacterium]
MAKLVVQTKKGPITRNFTVVQKMSPGKPEVVERIGEEVWFLSDGTGAESRSLTRVLPYGFARRPVFSGAIVGASLLMILLVTVRFLAI